MSRSTAVPLPKWIDNVLLPVGNVFVALLLAGLVIALIGQDPWQALTLLITGAFGNALSWSYTLYYATNFIFTGLAVAVALHAGHFNIGAEGQATMGGLAVGAVSLVFGAYLPSIVLIPLAAVAGVFAGALWAFIPGYLQAKRGSHIVVTTIMFNFLAASIMVWLLVNVLMPKGSLSVETVAFAESAHLPSAQTLLQIFGVQLPDTPLNLSFLVALAMCLVVWLVLWRTPTGYGLRTLGSSPNAAWYAGMNAKKLTMISMGFSGAIAALVGLNEIAGVNHKLLLNFTAGAGFVGIAVSVMGRNHPVGIIFASVLFGALYQGGTELTFEMPEITRDMVVAVQGFIILFCGAMSVVLRPIAVWLYRRSVPGRDTGK
jgi:general nucleoside transport system permease protein